jgi:hypothetical protein
VQSLGLERNMMGDRGCFALADALACNDTLLTLELQDNNIKSEGMYRVSMLQHLSANDPIRDAK